MNATNGISRGYKTETLDLRLRTNNEGLDGKHKVRFGKKVLLFRTFFFQFYT